MIYLSPKDTLRLLQCVMCSEDSLKCGCTERDEDENGFCNKYKERVKHETKKSEERQV